MTQLREKNCKVPFPCNFSVLCGVPVPKTTCSRAEHAPSTCLSAPNIQVSTDTFSLCCTQVAWPVSDQSATVLLYLLGVAF
jgi:hypothetical protein